MPTEPTELIVMNDIEKYAFCFIDTNVTVGDLDAWLRLADEVLLLLSAPPLTVWLKAALTPSFLKNGSKSKPLVNAASCGNRTSVSWYPSESRMSRKFSLDSRSIIKSEPLTSSGIMISMLTWSVCGRENITHSDNDNYLCLQFVLPN